MTDMDNTINTLYKLLKRVPSEENVGTLMEVFNFKAETVVSSQKCFSEDTMLRRMVYGWGDIPGVGQVLLLPLIHLVVVERPPFKVSTTRLTPRWAGALYSALETQLGGAHE